MISSVGSRRMIAKIGKPAEKTESAVEEDGQSEDTTKPIRIR